MLPVPRSGRSWMLLALVVSAPRVADLEAQEPCRRVDPSLPAPTDIQCLSFSRTRNVIYFWSADESATEYRLEHSVNRPDDFHDHDSMPVSDVADGNQPWFDDRDLDPEEVYYYRVRSYRASDGACSPYSAIVRSPRRFVSEGGHFQLFYNTSALEAPPMSEARGSYLNHLPGSTEEQLDALHRLGSVLEAVRAEYFGLGFRRPWQADTSQPLPINLKWICNGGQYPANGQDGAAISPEFLRGYDPVANEGDVRLYNTPLHELFHGVAQAYQGTSSLALGESWVQEGPTDAMADLACVEQEGACVTLDDEQYSTYFSLVADYLGDPGRTLTELSYPASLFWNYLCDHYGKERDAEPRVGIDFIRLFHEEAAAHPNKDAIEVVEATMQRLDRFDRFANTFMGFAVANYAIGRGFSGLLPRHKYTDDVSSLAYPAIIPDESLVLERGGSSGLRLAGVRRWAVRYHEVTIDPRVDFVSMEFQVETPSPAMFATIYVKDDTMDVRGDYMQRELCVGVRNRSVLTPGVPLYDKVIVIVAGLDEPVSYRYTIAERQTPALQIVQPTASSPACLECSGSSRRFLVRMQALDLDDLSRIEGLDPNAFTFELLSEPCTVRSAWAVEGEYWLILEAPALTNVAPNTSLALVARHPDIPDGALASHAITYCPDAGCAADTVLVLDRSSSMDHPSTKLDSAQEAARLYIDSFDVGDRVGIVSFNGSASDDRFNLRLEDWSDATRSNAIGVIDAIAAGGSTSIGDGLLVGLAQLSSRGRPGQPWSLVLLSDGLNTVDPDIAGYFSSEVERRVAGQPTPAVHAIGVGLDANRPDLEDLAARTGGTFHFITEPPGGGGGAVGQGGGVETAGFHRGLSELFRVVSEKVAGHQQVYSATGSLGIGQAPVVHRIVADAASSELVVVVGGDGRMKVALREPVTKVQFPPFLIGAEHRVFRIRPVEASRYELSLSWETACEGCPLLVDYLVEASVKSSIDFDLFLPLPPAERVVGAPMQILAALHGVPLLSNPAVTAIVERYDGAFPPAELQLHDDGRHGDGLASDGLYGNSFRDTHTPGDYRVEARAREQTARLPPFERRRIESFHLRGGEDPDGDGMPSEYELRVGLDPAQNDALLDADGDLVNNLGELRLGTDPRDPDTDDDGESDLEPWFGRDPLVPGDGVISPPRIRARAGVASVLLTFNQPRGAVAFDIYRAVHKGGSLELLADHFDPGRSLTFLDESAKRGITYRYQLISIGPNGERSGPSNAALATPALDPYPPHGRVTIDGGAPVTRTRQVTLQLTASDDPHDDHILPLLRIDPLARPSGVAEMIIANRSDFAAGPGGVPDYEPFSRTRDWVLEPDASGRALVFVRFRDLAGNVSENAAAAIRVDPGLPAGEFRRGDANADGRPDISDAIFALGFLFLGTPAAIGCQKSADSNDDGEVNISDAVHLLSHLFSGGAPPPAPYPDCGGDPTVDALTCASHPPCE